MKLPGVVVFSMFALAQAGFSQAMDPAAIRSAAAAQMKRNQQELREYSWKQKTQVDLKGETKSTRVELVRYDASGQLEKSVLNSSPQADSAQRGGRLKAHIVEKKKDKLKGYIENVMTSLKRYTSFSGGGTAFDKAQLQPGNDGTMGLRMNDYIVPGDQVTLYVDPVSRKPRKLQISTTVDNDPIKLVSEFQSIPNGPTYVANSVVDSPKKNLRLTVHSYDYQPRNGQ